MKCAPIIIPTMCRDTHFIRLIESLKRNTWAKYTDVFVGLDYPPSEKYKEGYNNICHYLKADFNEFKSFNVIRRIENYGSSRNLKELRDMVLLNYDRFIRTDDDAEFSPNFLEYMNKCLEKYKDDADIIAVTGYSYPIKWETSKGATILKENFSCPMWGTGFWRDKYKKIYKYIFQEKSLGRDADYIIRSGSINKMLNVAKYEFVNLCLSPEFENTLAAKMSDIAVRMYSATQNKFIIVPTTSKVRNWGFDGSGEYCKETIIEQGKKTTAKNFVYHQQTIDKLTTFDLIEDTLNANDNNKDIMNAFDILPVTARIKMILKKSLYLIIGKNKYQNFTILCRKKT